MQIINIQRERQARHKACDSIKSIWGDPLVEFWDHPLSKRRDILIKAIRATHACHFVNNPAYQRTVSARGIGSSIQPVDFPRLLRPTSQTFKSYIDVLGTPFPQDRPLDFLNWLDDQLSIELPRNLFERFHPHYQTLEAFLLDIEDIFAEFGFEISTSSGTSGRSTIMVRDQASTNLTVESFYLSFQRYLKMHADQRIIFIMPRKTRIAMVRMASFSANRVCASEDRIHYTIPFPAHPDQVRIRSGHTLRDGWRGQLERRFWYPFMNWANEHIAMPRAIDHTMRLLEQAEKDGEKVMLFGGWIQLHGVALQLHRTGRILRFPPGSLLGTGGGFKEKYPFNPVQIRQDLAQSIRQDDNQPVPFHDVYGMAEANWAAMQCNQGNYHIPPWIYAFTVDENDRIIQQPDSTGLLAFFDPIGGGNLFPSFFKTADQTRLINGSASYSEDYNCNCGEIGTYILQDSIQRVDLLNEAGCAAQL